MISRPVNRKPHSKKQRRRELDTRVGSVSDQTARAHESERPPADRDEADQVFSIARDNVVLVNQPLVLISQIQRSGGTLLNKLFDGHSEVHSHPSELHIGHPTKAQWPQLDLAATPDDWLDLLDERWIGVRFGEGFGKRTLNRAGYPSLPFMLPPSLLRDLFRAACGERPPRTARDILDHYFTAFFNAWLDCQGLRDEPKKWVTAFTPRLAWGQSRGRFWTDYPDGRLIACLRDPRGWYASASAQKERYADVERALALWKQGAEEILAAKAERPDAVFVLTYEDLVSKPEQVTRALARWLDIEWSPILLRPTFNRLRTVPNSSYPSADWGISTESLERWRSVLNAETLAVIQAQAMELDQRVRTIPDYE
jgi:hypothetical protein